jgi:hypothetical protein
MTAIIRQTFSGSFCQKDEARSGPNPTTSIYNASVVIFYNATDNLARFGKQCFLVLKTL